MFRRRFADVVARQLDLFESENAELLRELDAALRAYAGAGREDAEERYAAYDELVEAATDALADLREAYASTLDDDADEQYAAAFARAAGRRFPTLAKGL